MIFGISSSFPILLLYSLFNHENGGVLLVKKIVVLHILLVLCLLTVSSCSKYTEVSWQEQYDLGVRYLSECNYEEAIIAFSAAIEIDSRQAVVYEQLSYAYQEIGNLDRAIKVLQAGYEATGDDGLLESLELLQQYLAQETDAFFLTEQSVYLADGTLVSQTEVTYDEDGYMTEKIETTLSTTTGQYMTYTQTWTFDPAESSWIWWAAYGESDTNGVSEILEGPREKGLDNCGVSYQSVVADILVYPDSEGNMPEVIYPSDVMDSDDALWHHAEYEYDNHGNAVRITTYQEDGSILGWCENVYDYHLP